MLVQCKVNSQAAMIRKPPSRREAKISVRFRRTNLKPPLKKKDKDRMR